MLDTLCIVALIVLLVGMSGCASGPVQITEQMVDTAGNVIGTTTKTISDASVGKEESVHVTLRNRDKMIAASAKSAGMKVEWVTVREEIQVPGQQPIVMTRSMPEVSYTPQAEFNQPLPTAPSEHPVWRTIDNIGGKLINGTLIGYGIHEAAGVVNNAVDKAGDKMIASGENSTVTKTTSSASGEGTVNNGGSGETAATGACTISAAELSDCRTTTTGAATSGQYEACLSQDYGHTAEQISACPQ